MTRVIPSQSAVPRRGTRRRRRLVGLARVAAALGVASLVAVVIQRGPRPVDPLTDPTRTGASAGSVVPARGEADVQLSWLHPMPSPMVDAMRFSLTPPREPAFGRIPVAPPVADIPSAGPEAEPPAPETPPAGAMSPRIAVAPLPVPRPPELQAMREDTPRPDRRGARRAPAATPAPAEEPGFLEKFFGLEPSPKPALAYAALEQPVAPRSSLGRLGPDFGLGSGPKGGTAVYDITARTVTMPNGERLEAHSGLGDKRDDPRQVHVRMRGATPPGIYDLTERESLFHGVRAIRMTPLGGSAAIHGRDGILAHTYMLGPKGDSNGCVSFRDYDRFLQAFLRGEVRRLVVVPGGDNLPSIADAFRSGRQASREGT